MIHNNIPITGHCFIPVCHKDIPLIILFAVSQDVSRINSVKIILAAAQNAIIINQLILGFGKNNFAFMDKCDVVCNLCLLYTSDAADD